MFRPLQPRQIVVDVVVASLFMPVAILVEVSVAPDREWGVLSAILVVALFTGAVVLRRLSPGLALGVAWVAAITQMAFQRPPALSDVAVFAVLYTAAAYGSRRVYWFGFASSIVGAVVISVYLIATTIVGPGMGSLQSVLTTGVALTIAALFALLLAWTAGALVRTAVRARDNRRAELRAQEATATEQERVRIARDMHDVVAHSLAVVIAQADGARYAASADPTATAGALETISATAREALADVRLLLTQLRHSQGDGPQPTLADLDVLYAQVRGAGADLRVDVDPAPQAQPPAAVQLAVYRILQEALTNAMRHGDRGRVDVRQSWWAGRLDLEVRNGMGDGAASLPGHGVIGMRERAQLIGGTLSAAVEDGAFVVRAQLPLPDPVEAPVP